MLVIFEACNMEVRPAEASDIPAIVSLLKLSLGEALLPKSEEFWNWKHCTNPFGPSPVLLAVDSGIIVGVRAFMRWDWRLDNEFYSAVRAVDTATHPEYQGKGIFKKLTLALLEQTKTEGTDFVFNTPNAKSRPGYLKMGWKDAGKLPVQIAPILLGRVVALIRNSNTGFESSLPSGDKLSRLLNEDMFIGGGLRTKVSPEYLRWRYLEVPGLEYKTCYWESSEMQLLLFGRLKHSRFGTEFRVTDLFSNQRSISSQVKRRIIEYARNIGADYVTCSGCLRSRFSIGVQTKMGPITTVRPFKNDLGSSLMGFNTWTPSLGDLELF